MDATVLALGLHHRLRTTLASLERDGYPRFHLLARAAEDLFTLMAVEDALLALISEGAEAGLVTASRSLLVEAQRALLGLVRASTEEELRTGISTLRGALDGHRRAAASARRPALGARARRGLDRRVDDLLRGEPAPGREESVERAWGTDGRRR